MSKREIVEELHKSARKNFQRRKVQVFGLNDLYQGDLCDMQAYSDENDGYNYIFTVINCFSKFGFAEALKNKSADEVVAAMSKILKKTGKFKNFQTDAGKEFFNNKFAALMKKHGIRHYTTYSVKKAQTVERFNRTLKNKMWPEFNINGSYKWIHILEKIVKKYNNTKHRTIGMKPTQVNKLNEKQLLQTVFRKPIKTKFTKPLYKIGTKVRISKYKNIFEKSYTPNWSTEIFIIIKINPTNPATYMLKDLNENVIQGCFYEKEIHEAKHPDVYLVERVLKTKGKKSLIKWLGFKDPTWINTSDII